MSESTDLPGDVRQPTPQEIRNLQLPPERRRVFTLMRLAFASSAIVMLCMAVWFYFDDNTTIALVVGLFAILSGIVGAKFVVGMLETQAKVQVWRQDPLNRHQ